MRICSLVPAATETLFALGLGEALVGVSAACEIQPGLAKPRVVSGVLECAGRSSAEIDRAVRRRVGRGQPLFRIDLDGLRALRPELIVAQDLCEVCAIGQNDVRATIEAIVPRPQALWLHPHRLCDVLDAIRTLGQAVGCAGEAEELALRLARRLDCVRQTIGAAPRPKVVCLEWLDPLMSCGHWVPDVIAAAGGRELLGRAGERSRRVGWQQVREARADVLLLAPCGRSRSQTVEELGRLVRLPGWSELPAVRQRQVFVVDGSLTCPGPRLVDRVEALARLLHPAYR
ncbi:MAG: cobalamin-binding protein [Candidatus Omnitrophica bacterium]|nr:cobalamin-binding protein [Candidatus Omnitrophota bacterium]